MPPLEPVSGTKLGHFFRMFRGRPHLFNKVAWMIGARVLGMAIGVVGSVWAARCLGPRNFGISGMVQSLATFAVVFVNVVYPLLLVRDYKNAPNDEARNRLIQVTNGFRLVASLVICALAALLMGFHLEPKEFHLAGWFFLPILLLNALQPSWIFQAAEKQQFQAVLAVLQPMLLAFYYLIWIRPGMSAGPDLLGVTLVSAILTVVYWKAIFRLTAFQGRFFAFDRWDEARSLIYKSRWLFISALAIYVYNWLDQPLLGWLHSLEEQGRYRTAVRVTDAVQGFLTILPAILFPRFIEWRKKGEEFFWDRQRKILFFGGIVGGIVVLAGFILIPLLYPFVFGPLYVQAAWPCAILVSAKIVDALGQVYSLGLMTDHRHDKTILFATLVTGIFSLVVNIIFIPRFGMYSAAITNLLSVTLMLMICYTAAYRRIQNIRVKAGGETPYEKSKEKTKIGLGRIFGIFRGSKREFDWFQGNEKTALYRMVDTCDLISFDVFDTAILRNVLVPEDVFTIVGKKMGFDFDFKDFREKIEKKTWEKKRKASGTVNEVTLDEIYREMAKYALPNVPKSEIKKIKKTEIEVEKIICAQNPFLYDAYKYALQKNKKIIFTSDMYLPTGIVREILSQNGYKKFDRLYVSSEIKLTKYSGKLFHRIISDFKIHPGKILHVGDNPHSDVKQPRRAGFKTFYYVKCSEVATKDPVFRKFLNCFTEHELQIPMVSVWMALIANRFFTKRPAVKSDFFHRLGFWYLGMLNVGFVLWIHEQAIRNKVSKLFFLSRDGFLPQKVYEMLREKLGFKTPSTYLFASRKAFNIPGILKMGPVALDFLCEIVPKQNVNFYLERIGLDPEKYQKNIIDSGFKHGKERVRGSDVEKIEKLFLDIQKDILAAARKERVKIFQYLKEQGLFRQKSIAFIDFGWRGSMQKAYENLVRQIWKIRQKTFGFYLCVWSSRFPGDKVKNMDNMKGYLLHFGFPQEDKDFLVNHITLLEDFFPAFHGSVVGYEKNRGKVSPLCAISDRDSDREKENLIKGVLDFTSAYLKYIQMIPVEKRFVLKPLGEFIRRPTLEAVRKIGNHEYGTSFGAYRNASTVSNFPTFYQLLSGPPHLLLKNFMNSNWKEGYLTVLRMGFLIGFFEKATRDKRVRVFLKRLKMVMNGELGNRFKAKRENKNED